MSTFYPPDYTSQQIESAYLEDRQLWLGRLYVLVLRLFGHDPLAFSRYLKGRLLDVGCGQGALLHQLQKLGWTELFGVDTSPYAAVAASRPNMKILCSSVEDAAFPDGYFDYVVMKHVLERLHTPAETLSEVRRILAPRGFLFVEVPNNASVDSRLFGKFWAHLDVPRHLYFFTPKTVSTLINSSGFRVVKMYTYPNPANIPSTLSYLGGERLAFLRQGMFSWMIMGLAFPYSVVSSLFRCSSHLVVYAQKGEGN
jgi:SAM-dependent methyltransferase